jgi:hypothetical protein
VVRACHCVYIESCQPKLNRNQFNRNNNTCDTGESTKDISKQPRKRKAESTALSNLRNTFTLLAIVPTAPRQGVSCAERMYNRSPVLQGSPEDNVNPQQ